VHEQFIIIIIIIIIINEFHRDASLKQNFRAANCQLLQYALEFNLEKRRLMF